MLCSWALGKDYIVDVVQRTSQCYVAESPSGCCDVDCSDDLYVCIHISLSVIYNHVEFE